jgi:hypothetical protein
VLNKFDGCPKSLSSPGAMMMFIIFFNVLWFKFSWSFVFFSLKILSQHIVTRLMLWILLFLHSRVESMQAFSYHMCNNLDHFSQIRLRLLD